eukprot:tig00021133_g18913.t1
MVRNVTLALTQMSCTWDREGNVAKAERLVREAAAKGANIILLQELFETPYFCQEQKATYFAEARPCSPKNPTLARFTRLAAELKVVLPISFFESTETAHYNSVVVIDADGTCLGIYRKSHIPDGPGYQEKFYFNPGDTGFKVFHTKYGAVGVGICWDQWFPECARAMVLQGAEILFYPTAIGSEPPPAPPVDSADHWQRVMQGHAGANLVPLVASNRVGTETFDQSFIKFYGSSFIAGPTGEKVVEANKEEECVKVATFDLDAVKLQRLSWGVFRDRRPDLYTPLVTLDGRTCPRFDASRLVPATAPAPAPLWTLADCK